ncbi:MAG: tail fiber domain-containing protein, partial [Candidatus Pacebacteria bacterium]|nr:tail fiber domain-containing protein [Candidatus Paceibacterota bacterium]
AGASGVTLQSLTTKMTLLPSGFFGIGDTTPDYLLDIESLSTDTYMYSLHDSDGECLHDPEAGAETVTCSSDERLKTNIVDSDSVLEYLNVFRIRSYDVLASGDHMTGVIAQEVMQDYPELVSTLPSGMYSVQLPNQWKLVKGIQELDLKLKDISDFENENDNSFVAKLRNWFGNSANGIKKLFVKEEICIGETCINEEQLKALILNNQSNNVIENNEENIPIPEEESDENIDENPAVEEGTEDVIIEELEEVVTEGDVEENTETVVEPEIIN